MLRVYKIYKYMLKLFVYCFYCRCLFVQRQADNFILLNQLLFHYLIESFIDFVCFLYIIPIFILKHLLGKTFSCWKLEGISMKDKGTGIST